MRREVRMATEDMQREVEQLIHDKNYIQKNLIYHLVNRRNVRPTEIFDPIFGDDIGLVYRVTVNDNSAMVVNEDFVKNMFNGNLDRIRKLARQNTPRLRPAKLTGLNEMIFKLMGIPAQDDLEEVAYVLTNEQAVNGAACLMYTEIFETISEKVGGAFYVCPSSVHEVIIMPRFKNTNPDEIRQIIREVNAKPDCVKPEDYLGDNPIPSTEVSKAINKMLDAEIKEGEELLDFQTQILTRMIFEV